MNAGRCLIRIAAVGMAALFSVCAAIPAIAGEKLPPTSYTLNVPVKLSRIMDDVKIFVLYDVNIGMGYRARGEKEVPLKDGAFDGKITITGKMEYDARMDPMSRMRPGDKIQGTAAPKPQPYPGRYSCRLQIRYANGHTFSPDPNASLDGYRAAPGTPISATVEGEYTW